MTTRPRTIPIATCALGALTALSMTACLADFGAELDEDSYGDYAAPDEKIVGDGSDDDAFKATNLALSASTSASSTFCWGSGLHCYHSYRINDGSRNTTVGGYYSWSNDQNTSLPQWVQLDFGSSITFDRVVLYTSAGYEISDYDIQYWNGNGWYTAVSVNWNTSTSRTHTFSPRTASRIRVLGRRGPDHQYPYVRVNELEVYNDTCVPNTCQSWQCGNVSDGCGGTIYCGPCGSCGDGICSTGEPIKCPQDCCLQPLPSQGNDADQSVPVCPV